MIHISITNTIIIPLVKLSGDINNILMLLLVSSLNITWIHLSTTITTITPFIKLLVDINIHDTHVLAHTCTCASHESRISYDRCS